MNKEKLFDYEKITLSDNEILSIIAKEFCVKSSDVSIQSRKDEFGNDFFEAVIIKANYAV